MASNQSFLDLCVNRLSQGLKLQSQRLKQNIYSVEQTICQIDELRQKQLSRTEDTRANKLLDQLQLCDNDIVNIFKLQDEIQKRGQNNSNNAKESLSNQQKQHMHDERKEYVFQAIDIHIQDLKTANNKKKQALNQKLKRVDQRIDDIIQKEANAYNDIVESQSSDSFTLDNSFNVESLFDKQW